MASLEFKTFLGSYYASSKIDQILAILSELEGFDTPEIDMWIDQLLLMSDNVDFNIIEVKLFDLLKNVTRDLFLEIGVELELDDVEPIHSLLSGYRTISELGVDEAADAIFNSDYSNEEQVAELFAHVSQKPVEFFMPYFKEVDQVFIDTFINRDRGEPMMFEDEDERLLLIPVVKERLLRYSSGKPKSKFVEFVMNGLPLAMPYPAYAELLHEHWVDMDKNKVAYEIMAAILGSNTEIQYCKDLALSELSKYVDDADAITRAEVEYTNAIMGDVK